MQVGPKEVEVEYSTISVLVLVSRQPWNVGSLKEPPYLLDLEVRKEWVVGPEQAQAKSAELLAVLN